MAPIHLYTCPLTSCAIPFTFGECKRHIKLYVKWHLVDSGCECQETIACIQSLVMHGNKTFLFVVCRLSIIMPIILATDFNRRCGKLVYNVYCFLRRMMARLVEPGKHSRKMVCQCQMINILGSYTIFWCKRLFVPNRSVEIRRLIIWPINPSPPNVAYMGQWIGSVLVQIMACHLFGAKPLSKPMLDQLDP